MDLPITEDVKKEKNKRNKFNKITIEIKKEKRLSVFITSAGSDFHSGIVLA